MAEPFIQRRVPRVGYAYTLAAALLGILVAAMAVAIWRHTLPPLQQAYLWTYLRYGLGAQSPLPSRNTLRFVLGYQTLRQTIFDGSDLIHVFRPALFVTGSSLMVAMFFGVGLDAKRLNDFRKGKKLRGWEILTPSQFNRRMKGDGFALYIE